jgi:hypothetical protein
VAAPRPATPPPAASHPPAAPPLQSFRELEPQPPAVSKVEKDDTPAAFVCEEDVRSALDSHSRIVVGKKTIITPLARDLGEASGVFVVQG